MRLAPHPKWPYIVVGAASGVITGAVALYLDHVMPIILSWILPCCAIEYVVLKAIFVRMMKEDLPQ